MIKGYTHILELDIDTWFANCQKRLRVEIERISVVESKDWKIKTTSDGRISSITHSTQRLHQIAFLRVWEPLRNEWVDRCLLEPIAEGADNNFAMILLVMYKGRYLVQAKGEPGNNTPGRVVITTTVQASYTNISMCLSGKVPFTELYYHHECKKLPIIQDGSHLLNKINEVCFIELQEELENIPEAFYWVTLEEIRSFAEKG